MQSVAFLKNSPIFVLEKETLLQNLFQTTAKRFSCFMKNCLILVPAVAECLKYSASSFISFFSGQIKQSFAGKKSKDVFLARAMQPNALFAGSIGCIHFQTLSLNHITKPLNKSFMNTELMLVMSQSP